MEVLVCEIPGCIRTASWQRISESPPAGTPRYLCAEHARDINSDFSTAPNLQLEQQAAAAALLLQGVVNTVLFLLQANGCIRSWNPGAERLLGYTADEVIGRHYSLFYPSKDFAGALPEKQLRQAADHGRADSECWLVRKDETRLWGKGFTQALKDEAGQLRGYTVVITDLTEQKRSEEALRNSEERLRVIFEGATDHAIVAMDRHGTVTEWSAGAERILGYTDEEAIGRPANFIFTLEDRQLGIPAIEMEQALIHGRAEDERWHLKKDGSRIWASGVLTPLRGGDDGASGFVEVFRDHTLRRHAERERLMAERHASVLEERNRMARELHDTLAQGFTAIKLHLDVAEDAVDDDPQEARHMLSRAREIAQQSHMEARGSIRALRVQVLASGDLPSALAHLVDQAMTGPELDVRLVVEGAPFRLPADVETEMFRIAQEALTNALRHAHARNISVALTYAGSVVDLAVRDDGKGFDPQAGTEQGMGLYGLRERAERCHGELRITSAPTLGTEITFSLNSAILPAY